MNKNIRTIEIRSVMNGYIVHVGCQMLVFQSRDALLVELGRYLATPQAVEKEYCDRHGVSELNPIRERDASAYTEVAAPDIQMDPRIHDQPTWDPDGPVAQGLAAEQRRR